MRKAIAAGLVGLLLAACLAAFGEEAGAKAKAITWHPSYAAALTAAKVSGKPIMADVFADWCHYCKQLDEETYTVQAVIDLSAKFECVKIDGEKEPSVSEKLAIRGQYPTIVFLASDGREILRHVGFVKDAFFGALMKTALENQKLAARVPDLEAKIAADGNDAASLAALGHIYTAFAQSDKASELLGKAADLDKDGKLGLLQNVKLDQAIGESRREDKAAIEHLDAWLTSNPDSVRRPEARYHLGFAQAVAGKFDDALKSLDAVTTAAPDSPYSAMAKHYAQLIRDRMPAKTGG